MSGAATPALAADWDIAGIKLGMTEAEARAALKAFDAQSPIKPQHQAFSYSDGVSHFQTPPFLNALQMTIGPMAMSTGIKVWFSDHLSGEPRVIGVARRHQDHSPAAPTLAKFNQSLEGKYGKPTGVASPRDPVWEEAGKPSCIRVKDYYGKVQPGPGPFTSMAQSLTDPRGFENEIEKNRAGGAPLPKDLATCGTFVFYSHADADPVKVFYGGLFDVGAMIATERARNKWVDDLEAEAVRKRESQSQGPRL